MHGNTMLELDIPQDPARAKRASAHAITEETSWSVAAR